MENIPPKKAPSSAAADDGKKCWTVVAQMPTKAIRFSLSDEECRERRTISWLNNPAKKPLVDTYRPTYPGFREIHDAEIIIKEKEILHYKSFYLNLDDVIFVHDEYQQMGNKKHLQHPEHQRLTPDGIDIITRSSGTPAYHINCHIYNFNACLVKYQFIPMTNVLIKQLDGALTSSTNRETNFFPFLALNRAYIDGFSILFKGSRIRQGGV